MMRDRIRMAQRWFLHTPTSPHRARRTVAAFLLGLFYLVAVTRVVDVDDVRRTVAATGPLRHDYVVVAAVLAAVFVPGPILAAGSGVLGPVLGVRDAWRDGRNDHHQPLRRRAAGRASTPRGGACGPSRPTDQRRTVGIVGQRFIPGISDALASYAFGAFGFLCGRWQSERSSGRAAGFAYTALGASIGDLSSPLAYTAVAVWCVTAIIGAFATHRGYRKWRGRAGGGRPERDGDTDPRREPEPTQ
jgi:uncharacterized membrane protein YdjX (TVP38/TMEM64 family)